jgi:hypothetical protein
MKFEKLEYIHYLNYKKMQVKNQVNNECNEMGDFYTKSIYLHDLVDKGISSVHIRCDPDRKI